MSRMKAKAQFTMEEFENSMQGIFTTSVCKDTLDELPMAYKNMNDIIDVIGNTVEIVSIIKPIYNFKASEELDINNNETKISKFISLILRHKPETINIELDSGGWANVNDLIQGIDKKGHALTLDGLKMIVANDNKGRYVFSDDYQKI